MVEAIAQETPRKQISDVSFYIERFAGWLTSISWPPKSTGERLDAIDLVRLLAPWVEEAYQIVSPVLRDLSIHQAAELSRLLNQAMDIIEEIYSRGNERFAHAVLLLSPIEDLLIALSMIECGLLPPKTSYEQ